MTKGQPPAPQLLEWFRAVWRRIRDRHPECYACGRDLTDHPDIYCRCGAPYRLRKNVPNR